AAKVTGRTRGGLSLGAMAALTERERGRAFFRETGATRAFTVEPRTAYGVLRLRQDLSGGASTFGSLLTLLQRDLPSDGSLDILPRAALGAGIDWELQWNDREWAFYGYVAGSHVRGDSTALIRIQRSSTHYFQRPDSRRLEMDSSATAMSGIDWRMSIERRRGTHWLGSIWAAQVTPGFEINDLGFSGRQEVLDGGARVTYREINPGRVLRSYNINLFTFHNWSHDALTDRWSARSWGRAHVAGSVNLRADARLLNYWRIATNLSLRPELADRVGTRGGPLMLRPRSYETELSVETDERKAVSVRPSVALEQKALDAGSRVELGLGVQVRPSSRVELSVEPEWSRCGAGDQYVASSGALPYAPTFGRRYVFADLERRELALETRLNFTASPRLSLQLYAQPLLSSGDYVSYKQLLAPETFAFDPFQEGTHTAAAGKSGCGTGRTCVDATGKRFIDFDGDGSADLTFSDQDFNLRSLVGNAVLRWEYRPGSTLFLVWQRRQADRSSLGDFAVERDARALLRAPGTNIFMLKVQHWIGF
ncbi:MAG: DUF5916 domain-containing protein, partial [Gemmatimonadaceae bacterium]